MNEKKWEILMSREDLYKNAIAMVRKDKDWSMYPQDIQIALSKLLVDWHILLRKSYTVLR